MQSTALSRASAQDCAGLRARQGWAHQPSRLVRDCGANKRPSRFSPEVLGILCSVRTRQVQQPRKRKESNTNCCCRPDAAAPDTASQAIWAQAHPAVLTGWASYAPVVPTDQCLTKDSLPWFPFLTRPFLALSGRGLPMPELPPPGECPKRKKGKEVVIPPLRAQ